jgi:hypothetical protein
LRLLPKRRGIFPLKIFWKKTVFFRYLFLNSVMSKIIRMSESELVDLIKKTITENEVEEGILDNVKDTYRGLKGVVRGYGMDYFKSMSRLQSLVSKLKKLDVPNIQVMSELTQLKNKVNSLNIPQQRKQNLIALIDNSLYHFNQYNTINDQILNQIKTLNIDKWK